MIIYDWRVYGTGDVIPYVRMGNILVLVNGMNLRDVRVKVKSSKGNPGSTDLISDRLCDMV